MVCNPLINWFDVVYYKNGNLYWKQPLGYKIKADQLVGWVNSSGYRIFCYNKKYYFVARVIWELLNEPIPKGYEVDHADRNKCNNKIENLRLATRSQNGANRNSKLKGISWSRSNNSYRIDVSKGNQRFIGYAKTIEEAKKIYNEQAKIFHGEFAYQHETH